MTSVLFVDDEPAILDAIKQSLERKGGFSIDTALSAQEALGLLQARAYDVILSDYQMPKMNGIQFLKHLRSSGNTIPFIIFTGRGGEEIAVEAYNAGADAYIVKGGASAALILDLSRKIEEIISRKRMEKQLAENEAFLDSIVENIPDMIFVKEAADLRFVRFNRAGEDLLGHSRAEMLGKNDYDLFPRAEADFFTGNDRDVLSTKRLKDIPEERIQTRTMEERVLHTKKIPLLDEKGDPKYLLGISEDITERKQAEEKTRRLAAIVESSDDAIISKTLDGTIISWNRGAEKTYGYSAPEIIGKPIAILIPPGWKNDLQEIMDTIKRGEHFEHYETSRVRKDGILIQISLTVSPLFDNEGRIVGASTIARDITRHKKVEDALRMAEEKYRSIFENAVEGIYQISLTGKLVTANPAMARILGYSSPADMLSTVVNTKNQLWVNDEQREQYLRRLREAGRVQGFECEYYRKDRSRIWVSLNTRIIRGAGGAIICSEGFIQDITERKNAEKALKESEEMFRNPVENSPVGVFLIQDNAIRYANPRIGEILGYTRDELLLLPIEKLISAGDMKRIGDIIAGLLQGRKGGEGFEFQGIRKDGTPVDLIAYGSSMQYGGCPAIYGSVMDISERRQMQEKIEKSLKEKEMLLKEIHHRVKNNLQVVSSLLFMQARVLKDENMKEILKESQNRIKSIALVHEKLYQSTDLDRIDYTGYLRKITDHLFESYQVDHANIRLQLNAGEAVLHIDKAIPCSLIINEMISNSLKHAFPKGRKGLITIDLRKDADAYVLTYSDDGIGIPGGITFDRTESLGMQLIRGLTKQIGGTIALDRTAGTKYTVRFPG